MIKYLIKSKLNNSFAGSLVQMAKSSNNKKEINLSTEEKFKEAARIVFTKKGYAATRTRDIAQQAGLNLALLNYYFRSKEKLFEIVMLEKVQQLFESIEPGFNDPTTSLEEKFSIIASQYIDMLIKNPDLPIFVLSEIRNNPKQLAKKFQLKTMIGSSYFVKQLSKKKKNIDPVQLFLSFMGMLVFPFIIKPVLESAEALNDNDFKKLMQQRKRLIADWMKNIIN